MSDPGAAVLAQLRSPALIRTRCRRILAGVAAGKSDHFAVESGQLEAAADHVAAVTRKRYPDLVVPYHSRWRHFEAGGHNRHVPLRRQLLDELGGDQAGAARGLVDLAVVSVLLDAGAGARWSYREGDTGIALGRSEGLALASLAGFRAGVFSSDPRQPLRVDAAALQRLTGSDLARMFQVSNDNPLIGLAGRTRLMNALGRALADNPEFFGAHGRPGVLIDSVPRSAERRADGSAVVAASAILESLLVGLTAIWPSGQTLGDATLGDCWQHRLATPPDYGGIDAGWVPFHKLSQWLTYSLLEPFGWAGITVTGLDQLTGLPEYRNGGLFLDTGVLALKDPGAASTPHQVGSELVVEWRALTVALIDEIVDRVRLRLRTAQAGTLQPATAPPATAQPATRMPLAAILEGGTWAAGRELAFARRGGEPPLCIVSDGTVF